MSTLPLHPAVVHVPLGLAFVIPLLAIGLAVAYARGRLPRSTFAVLLGLQVVLVAGGAAALKLGERDEKLAERFVPERLVEEHEERAELFLGAAAVVLAGMIGVLVVPRRAAGALAGVVAAGTVLVAGLGLRAGEAGGALVYRHGAAAAWATPGDTGGAAIPSRERHARDDD